jgi:hypothetical protein
VAGYIHWTICYGVTGKYYEQIPERVINVNGTTIMWDVPVITDRTMLANQPDIVLHDKKEKTCLLINTAIPDDSSINKKETEVQRPGVRNQQDVGSEDKIVQVIDGALGTIKKGSDRNLHLLPGQVTG